MMMTDLGERCDRHSGETYFPRCYDCTAAQVAPLPLSKRSSPVDNSTPDLVADALASWGLVTLTKGTER